MKSTGIVASAGDVVLYEKDVQTLEPGAWLNDQVIAFFFERLAAECASDDVLLLEPSIVFTARMLQDSAALAEMCSVSSSPGAPTLSARLSTASLVLMPINNNEDPEALEGGGHWSLLCFRRASAAAGSGGRYEHYDSCAGANAAEASAVAKCLAPLLLPGERGPRVQLVKMVAAQQANSWDCGVYVICFAELLCRGEQAELIRSIAPQVVADKRRACRAMLREASS